MPDPAQNNISALPYSLESLKIMKDQGKNAPWQRQPDEKMLWYNRFKLYVSLGPKRSLQAAVAKEKSKMRALKSAEEETGAPSPRAKAGVKVANRVPGAWSDASVRHQWVQRALAYDSWVIERTIEEYHHKLYSGLGSKEHRVYELSKMAMSLIEESKRCTGQNKAVVCARAQSIMADIAKEMRDFDEQVSRYVLHAQAEKMYVKGETASEEISALIIQSFEDARQSLP